MNHRMSIYFLLGAGLFICTPSAPHDLYEKNDEFLKKVEIFELLITSTYGPHNPFSEIPLIIKSTCNRAHDLARITGTLPEAITHYAAELEHTLYQINITLTEFITTYEQNTFREPILAKLITLCTTSMNLLSQETTALPARHKKKSHKKKTRQHRFVPFISSSILVTAGKCIAASAASIWLLYVIHKIYSYITLPNIELIEETKENQQIVYDRLRQIRGTLTLSTPAIPKRPWWQPSARLFHRSKRSKDNDNLQDLATQLTQQLPNNPTVNEWTFAMTKLIEAFPQQ
jgi:hypothetical protein